jgi:hypothetical protein
VTDQSHNPLKFARPLERALIKIMRADAAICAEREATEETIWHDEAREKMRVRALERAAAKRKSTAAVPGKIRRMKR